MHSPQKTQTVSVKIRVHLQLLLQRALPGMFLFLLRLLQTPACLRLLSLFGVK